MIYLTSDDLWGHVPRCPHCIGESVLQFTCSSEITQLEDAPVLEQEDTEGREREGREREGREREGRERGKEGEGREVREKGKEWTHTHTHTWMV